MSFHCYSLAAVDSAVVYVVAEAARVAAATALGGHHGQLPKSECIL